MTLVLVPVRYPLTKPSKAAVLTAAEIAQNHDGDLAVLHVNLYQNDRRVRPSQLRQAVERDCGRLPQARYVVRRGLFIEEAIRDEATAEQADIVVLEGTRAGYAQRVRRRLFGTPDVEQFLQKQLDCQIITASTQEQPPSA